MVAGVVSRLRGWESASHLSNSCNKQRLTKRKKQPKGGGSEGQMKRILRRGEEEVPRVRLCSAMHFR